MSLLTPLYNSYIGFKAAEEICQKLNFFGNILKCKKTNWLLLLRNFLYSSADDILINGMKQFRAANFENEKLKTT